MTTAAELLGMEEEVPSVTTVPESTLTIEEAFDAGSTLAATELAIEELFATQDKLESQATAVETIVATMEGQDLSDEVLNVLNLSLEAMGTSMDLPTGTFTVEGKATDKLKEFATKVKEAAKKFFIKLAAFFKKWFLKISLYLSTDEPKRRALLNIVEEFAGFIKVTVPEGIFSKNILGKEVSALSSFDDRLTKFRTPLEYAFKDNVAFTGKEQKDNRDIADACDLSKQDREIVDNAKFLTVTGTGRGNVRITTYEEVTFDIPSGLKIVYGSISPEHKIKAGDTGLLKDLGINVDALKIVLSTSQKKRQATLSMMMEFDWYKEMEAMSKGVTDKKELEDIRKWAMASAKDAFTNASTEVKLYRDAITVSTLLWSDMKKRRKQVKKERGIK